jgi:prolyl-tRNA synthetase
VDEAIRIYTDFYRQLAVPVLASKRPDWDKFPGADYTIATDALMPDGKTLQVGTAHHLGDNFAKTFDITYEDAEGEQVYAHQTCYGVSERSIAALISIHGDDKGLVLPPAVAPVQVVIIPIIFKKAEGVLEACEDLKSKLEAVGIRVKMDASDDRPGAKYYKWEMKGVPVRLELGPRDLKNNAAMLARRDTGEKQQYSLDTIVDDVSSMLDDIHDSLYEKAKESVYSRVIDCETLDDVRENLPKGIAKIFWCGNKECGLKLEDETGAGILGIPTDQKECSGKCPVCGSDAETKVYVARTY